MGMCSNDAVKSEVAESLYPRDMGGFRDFGLLVDATGGIHAKEISTDLFPLALGRAKLLWRSHTLGVTTAEVRVSVAVR